MLLPTLGLISLSHCLSAERQLFQPQGNLVAWYFLSRFLSYIPFGEKSLEIRDVECGVGEVLPPGCRGHL